MDDNRFDLSPLDPTTDGAAWDRRIRAIVAAAAPELARRAAARHPLQLLSEWARPMLPAAAVLAIAATSVITLASRTAGFDPIPGPGIAESLMLPQPVLDWVAAERAPTISDLIVALEGDGI